ncbi:hypothetical protein [Ruminococcus sp. FC2018]|uniref:hypothetical protein n=1 Tax=Ruminococcus sp. FC2018 TaxID=1410617 RepID=UPI0006848C31|nr:hypothetical protein [Ruminococcus sp. FC2018]
MNSQELINYLLAPAGQVMLVIGLAEVFKKIGCPIKYIPLIDLVLGLACGIFVCGIELGFGAVKGVMIGLAIGLSACGLFSGIKNTVQKLTKW